jgi:hypothetical protein
VPPRLWVPRPIARVRPLPGSLQPAGEGFAAGCGRTVRGENVFQIIGADPGAPGFDLILYRNAMDDTVGAAGEMPTMVVPLRVVIEEANAAEGIKHLEGEINSFQQLLQPGSLEQLVAASPGLLAYLAFHPQADTSVAEYVKHGSLGSDSGSRILVLFAADAASWTIKRSDDASLFSVPGLTVNSEVHPSYEMIKTLFAPAPSPPLPGIVFFQDFAENSEAVYASLAGLETSLQVTERMRTIFSVVEASAFPGKPERFADSVSVALEKHRLAHARSGPKSLREWFVHGCQAIYDHRGDILAVAALVPGV